MHLASTTSRTDTDTYRRTRLVAICCVTAQPRTWVNDDLDHDWWPGGTLRFIGNPSLGLGDRGIIAERILRIILVLLQTMFPRRVPTGGRGLAVIAGVRLVVWVVCVPVALDRVGPGRVVIAGGEVAEVVVSDLLTWLLRLLRLRGESSLALGWVLGLVVVLGDSSAVEVLLVLVLLLVVGVVGVLGVKAERGG
jgi:hypothetical protein